ncbi:MAG: Gfo/Idh/MocA family oxidoreductase [Verrucomicrobiota bacterium JB022]|nr:Gfo/Idh/MocA family oxidoreductase [Verrucomicrobiota bacterium JB022]
MNKPSSVRLGIVGAGGMGSVHARSVRDGKIPQLELTAIADTHPQRLEAFKGLATFTSADALIASGKVDAVLIATPHYSHTTIGIAALNAGLHVLVEKPISVHKEDCEKLIAAHRPDSGQIFAAMFNQRTDPRYRKVKQMLTDGTLGKLQRLNWIITDWFRCESYYRSGGWRATWAGEGGGVLLNQCPHQLDLWQWLFGMPQRVTAHCQLGRFHEIEVEDSVTALLDYENGVQGVFVTTTGEAPGTNRLEIVGENGKIIVEEEHCIRFIRNEVSSATFSRASAEGFAKPPVWNIEIPVEGRGPQHDGILANFTQAILGQEELIAPASEGIRSVELGNAMLLSSIRDQPVTVPLDAQAYAAELKKRSSRPPFERSPRDRTVKFWTLREASNASLVYPPLCNSPNSP